MIQKQQYFLGVLHILNCKCFKYQGIPLFLTITDIFGSCHRLFLIFTHIKCSYAQYTLFFPFGPILINGPLMTTQMAFIMIIIPFL